MLHELDAKNLEEKAASYGEVAASLIGKKPIRPEILLALLSIIEDGMTGTNQELQQQLDRVGKVIELFNTEYTGILKQQITKNQTLQQGLIDEAKKTTKLMDDLHAKESQLKDINQREQEVDKILDNVTQANKRLDELEEIHSKTAKTTDTLTNLAEAIKSNLESIEKRNEEYDAKIQQYQEQLKAMQQMQDELAKSSLQQQEKEKELNQLEQQIIDREQRVSDLEKAVTAKEAMLNDKEKSLQDIQEQVMVSQMDSNKITDELVELQKTLAQTQEDAAKTIAQKEYLKSVEETIVKREAELAVGTTRLAEQESTYTEKLNKLQDMSDSIESNLKSYEVTTKIFGDLMTKFSTSYNSMTALLNNLDEVKNRLGEEIDGYHQIGDTFNSQLLQIKEQRDSAVKINVLTNYTQKTLSNIQNMEINLSTLMEMVDNSRKQQETANSQLQSSIISLNELYGITKEQLVKSGLDPLTVMKYNETLEKLKEEVEAIEKKRLNKLAHLSELNENIRGTEQELLKTKLEGATKKKGSKSKSEEKKQ